MRVRTIFVFAALLVLAACGAGGTTLRYGYVDGQVLRYSFTETLTQHMIVEAPELGPGAEVPGEIDNNMRMDGSMTVASTELDDGTTRVRFSMEIDELSGETVAGGERVDLSDPALAAEFTSVPVEFEVVIDDQGQLVEFTVEAEGESLDLIELFGGNASGLTGGVGNEAMFGIPEFPDEPVEIGTSWEVDTSQEMFGQFIESGVAYTVSNVENEVVTIEVEAAVGPFSMNSEDLIQFLSGMSRLQRSEAFGGPISEQDLEEVLGLLDFEMQSEASTGTGTLRFDAAAGVTVSSSLTMDQVITMSMSIPDQVSGQLVEMSMNIEQSFGVEMSLQGGGSL